MPGASFLKSTAVRLAIIYIVLFVTASLGANITAYQMVVRFLDERLNANVQERYREIASAFEARGLQGAVDMIDNHGLAIRGRRPSTPCATPPDNCLRAAIDFRTSHPAIRSLNLTTITAVRPTTSFQRSFGAEHSRGGDQFRGHG